VANTVNPRFRSAALAFLLLFALAPVQGRQAATLPASLTDKEFWALTEQISEPNGYFRSRSGSPDNLLSNENTISTVAGQLQQQVKPGGVYLGVGPEQNFTYINAIRPRIAFVTDIRRGNLHVHLVYKAVFELTTNRADFLARLFSRRRPAGLTDKSTARELLYAIDSELPIALGEFQASLKTILDHLMRTRGLPLDADDRQGIEYVLGTFREFGPAINYTSSINGRYGGSGSYAAILSAIDRTTGTERTYLATEDSFKWIKALETKNLIVPLVGDFAGPKALRELGRYLKARGATVSAFYVSNVEDYLQTNGVWSKFCANVATFPLDADSVFIRPGRGTSFSSIIADTRNCGAPQ
jgi:hypothetical protein